MTCISRNHLVLAALLMLLAALPHAAWAANCTVNSPTLAFGAYDSVTGSAVTSTAALNISCSGGGRKNLPVTIALNAGLHSGGSFNPRVMQSTPTTTGTLNYNLYINTTYIVANIWGNGTAGTNTVLVTTNTGNPATATATVDGQIPGAQDPLGVCPATPCSYGDTLTITINF
jgi:spore coat protein U-like protein